MNHLRTTFSIGLAAALAIFAASTSGATERMSEPAPAAPPSAAASPSCDPAIVHQIAMAAITTAP